MINAFRPSKTLTYVKHGNSSDGYYLDGCRNERTIGKRKVKLVKYFPDSKQVLVEEDGRTFRESVTSQWLSAFTFSSKESKQGLDADKKIESTKRGFRAFLRKLFGR